MPIRTSSFVSLTVLLHFCAACGSDSVTPLGEADGSGGTSSSSGGSGNGGAGAPGAEQFELLFEDDFDTLDTTRWLKASHTFAENAAQFDPSMVTVENGELHLRVEKADTPSAEGREYLAGELRTDAFFGYGKFEARIQFAAGSGLVSSLFTYYDHWGFADLEENWNEIDIEFLGKSPDQVQFNVIHWNAQNQRTTHEHHVSTAFEPASEFHEYAIEWLPHVVRFYIDGQLVHSQTDQIAEYLTLDSRLMMNIWPVMPSVAAWAGTLDESALPAVAKYDWVRVYRYVE